MLCYRDMEYCKKGDICANTNCGRKLNREQYEADCKHTNFDFPIAYADYKNNECGFIPVKNIENTEPLEDK